MREGYTIRPATFDDGPVLLGMVRDLHAATNTDRYFSLSENDAANVIAASIDSDKACAMVAAPSTGSPLPVAAIIGAIAAPPFNQGFRIAQEFVLWVAPKHRKAGLAMELASAFEKWARESGANAVVLGFTHGCSESAMGRVCKRRGLIPMESVYIKRLGEK